MNKYLRILVVDDSAAIRRIVIDTLRELGLKNTLEAENGAAGWEVLQKQTVDLVLCDIRMPVMSGLELLDLVRKDKKFHALPFIMITAEAEREIILEAVKLGVSGYVIKPFNAPTLRDKILRVMKQ
ncbi:MAG: response regulator [Proteobacteria bacterium]|nr:response regulator [Pseudomonadota bacterium]